MRYRITFILRVMLLAMTIVTGGACHTNRSRPVSGSAAPSSARPGQNQIQPRDIQQGLRSKSAPTKQVALTAHVVKLDEVAIGVANHDSSEVRLQDRLEVERYTDEGWKAFDTQDVKLRYSCESEVGTCVVLLPGAELFPPPWQAASGPSQCRSRIGSAAPRGRYRFVAKSCDQAFVVLGEPFQL